MTDRARELLERALESFDYNGAVNDFVLEEIRVYLAEPEQDEEPKTHEPWCAYLTQMLMSNPPQRSECNCKNTTAPRSDFVRLSEEEIRTWNIVGHESLLDFVKAIEDALEEKNTINKSDPDSVDLQSRCRGDKL